MSKTAINLADQAHERKQVASYSGARPDVLAFINPSKTVLDVGCNEGILARAIIDRYPDTKVWGMDINADSLRVAEGVLEDAYCINLDQQRELEICLDGLTFDTIIAADVLEHTINPWRILMTLRTKLNAGGEIILSLPNFGHWETLFHIFMQKFPRRSRGLYDDTHLRFFFRRNLEEFATDGFRVKILRRNFRCYERRKIRVDGILKWTIGLIPWLREFFVFQWIIQVKKGPSN